MDIDVKDYRWVTCSKDSDWATAQYRHLVTKGGLTTLCGATASHPDVWRGNSTKLNCEKCMIQGADIIKAQTEQLVKQAEVRQERKISRAEEIVEKLARVAEITKEAEDLLLDVEKLVHDDYISADGAAYNAREITEIHTVLRVGFHRQLRRVLNDWEGYLAARKR